jgi:enoyl-CoA hydratase/carnithine racemase
VSELGHAGDAGDRVVTVEQDGGVLVVTLDRPEARNAFTAAMGRQLDDAYRQADADDSVRVVVLTGAGSAFCAGADFSRGAGVFGAPGEGFRSDPFTFHAWQVRKPVIAAVNGHAVGIGFTLTLHCDIRIMAAEARWGVLQARRGVVGDCRVHWTLPRLVGASRAAEIILGGGVYPGTEAVSMGVASRVLPAAEVLPAALALAHEMAVHTAPLSVAASKQMLWRGVDDSDGGAGVDEAERQWHLHLMGRPDAREGVEAFLERRDPRWVGSISTDWPADTETG